MKLKINRKIGTFYIFLAVFFGLITWNLCSKLSRRFSDAAVSKYIIDDKDCKYINLNDEQLISIPVMTGNLTRIRLFGLSDTEFPNIKLSIDDISCRYYYRFERDGDSIDHKEKLKMILVFQKPISHLKGKNLNIKIESSDFSLKTDNSDTVIFKQDGFEKKYIFIFIIILLVLIVGFCAFLFFTRNLSLHNKYLLFSLVFGLICILSRPPCSLYDDLTFYDTCYNMSNMMLGMGDSMQSDVIQKRKCDTLLLPNFYEGDHEKYLWAWTGNGLDYFRHLKNHFKDKPDETIVNVPCRPIRVRPQRAFIVPALAFTLGRLLHFNQFILFYFGAFCNLLVNSSIIYLGLRKNKFFNSSIIASVAFFPNALFLLASISYDSILIALFFTITNYAITFYNTHNKWDLLILAILSLVIFPIKTVYFLAIALLPLFYLFRKNKTLKRNLILITLGFICLYILSIIVINTFNITFFKNHGQSFNRNDILSYSAFEALTHPIKSLTMILNTFFEGQLNSVIDFFMVKREEGASLIFQTISILFFIILSFSLDDNSFEFSLSSLIVLILTGLLICLVAITWTAEGDSIIIGLQMRYFIPILPLFYFAIAPITTKIYKINSKNCFTFLLLFDFFYFIDKVITL